jgi:NitT/TauT family transport system substrate-binding protein
VQQRLGDNAVIALPTQVGQPNFLNLVCRSDWIANNTQTVKNLLNALYQSEQYYQNNPIQAQSAIQQYLNLTNVDPITWSNTEFTLSLEQSLVVAMKDEAQWMINNHITNQTQVPNMVDYIYTDGLKAVKPDAVTIIK